ncbi:hypothetical protein [Actinokineospora sp.]|uniref:hypothetical protein n=1 Tax=Actinokineospora sp. TaxID=1872133 RepID=UPI003D6B487D
MAPGECPHGAVPSKVGQYGRPVIDLSKVSKPPQIGNRYFTYNSGEFYPVAGAEWMLAPIPGHVDPDYPWWVQVLIPVAVAGAIAAAMACVGSGPLCLANAAGTAEATAPPMAVTVPVATVGLGIGISKAPTSSTTSRAGMSLRVHKHLHDGQQGSWCSQPVDVFEYQPPSC